jgi:hypothetical protein
MLPLRLVDDACQLQPAAALHVGVGSLVCRATRLCSRLSAQRMYPVSPTGWHCALRLAAAVCTTEYSQASAVRHPNALAALAAAAPVRPGRSSTRVPAYAIRAASVPLALQ